MDEYSETLSRIYERLEKNPNDVHLAGINIYRSEIHYIRSHLNAKFGKRYTLDEVYTLLLEEGLIDA